MRSKEYKAHLEGIGYNQEQVRQCMAGAEDFSLWLETSGRTEETATADDVHAFAAHRISEGTNERLAFIGVYQYAGMIGNHAMTVGVLDLLDGFEILGNLHRFVGEILGGEAQDRVFRDVPLPVIGTTPLEWTRVMSQVMPRLETETDSATVKRILGSGLRDLRDEYYVDFKERFEKAESLDAFLADRKRRHDEALVTHRDEGTLYFNQRIDDGVLEFVAAHQEIGGGVRDGSRIVEVKIPHMSIEYLATDDLRMKQYYVCHCPCVKEAIARDDLEISPTVCEFCPSFNAKPWEVAYGQRLETEVLESALRGDAWCKFAIHLPETDR